MEHYIAKIELYANCNPLSKNAFICVESSRNYGCSLNHYRQEILPESIKKLKSLGLQCYTVVTTEQRGEYL